jgi:hypothetical protein
VKLGQGSKARKLVEISTRGTDEQLKYLRAPELTIEPGWLDRSGNVYSGSQLWDLLDNDEDTLQAVEDAGVYGNYHDVFSAVTGQRVESLLGAGWLRWTGDGNKMYAEVKAITPAQRRELDKFHFNAKIPVYWAWGNHEQPLYGE